MSKSQKSKKRMCFVQDANQNCYANDTFFDFSNFQSSKFHRFFGFSKSVRHISNSAVFSDLLITFKFVHKIRNPSDVSKYQKFSIFQFFLDLQVLNLQILQTFFIEFINSFRHKHFMLFFTFFQFPVFQIFWIWLNFVLVLDYISKFFRIFIFINPSSIF